MGPRRNAATLFGLSSALLALLLGAALLIGAADPPASAPPASSSGPGSSDVATPGPSTPPPASPGRSPLPSPPSPSPTPPLFPTPGPSSSPTPTASAAARYVTVDGAIAFVAADGTLVPVPAVTGLEAGLRDGRVVYAALAGNGYGLRAGAYAGEFKPNVIVQQADGSSAQTGGAVLAGPVVSRLIGARFAATKTAADRWVVALPVDVRSVPLAGTVAVSFDDDGPAGSPRVLVEFPGRLPVVNVVPGNRGYHVLVEQVDPAGWQCIDPARLDLPGDAIDPVRPMSSLVLYGPASDAGRHDIRVDVSVPIGRKLLDASGSVSAAFVAGSASLPLGPDRILALGDVPIFVAAGS